MPQVIEHAHEQHDVESLAERRQVVHAHPPELDLKPGNLSSESRLREEVLIGIDPDDALGSAASSRSNKTHRCSRCPAPTCLIIPRELRGKSLPLYVRVIVEKVIRRRADADRSMLWNHGPSSRMRRSRCSGGDCVGTTFMIRASFPCGGPLAMPAGVGFARWREAPTVLCADDLPTAHRLAVAVECSDVHIRLSRTNADRRAPACTRSRAFRCIHRAACAHHSACSCTAPAAAS